MITWWLGRGADPGVFRRNFAEPYRAGDPPVELRVEYLGADSEQRTLAALADGTAPDIVMIPRAGTHARLAREGHFADLSGYGWTRRVLPLALAIGTHGGRLYGIPRSSETMLLLSNRALFEAHDWRPPQTLRELDDLATAMQRRGIVPFGAGAAACWRSTRRRPIPVPPRRCSTRSSPIPYGGDSATTCPATGTCR